MASRAGAESVGPRGLRRGMVVAGVTIVVMAASAAIVWSAYRVMSHQGGPVPLIQADESPVKVPPANPGGMTVPDQNIAILNGKGPGDSRIEQLLPSPEAPLPRPAPAEPQVTEPPPAAAPVAKLPVPPPPAIAAPAATVSAAPPPPAAPAATAAVAAPPPPVAAALTQAVPQRVPEQAYRLQVGAVRTEEAAQQEWARLKRAHADVLGRLDMRTARADVAGRGIYYRIEAGPIADAAAAQRACDALKQRKVGCILVRP